MMLVSHSIFSRNRRIVGFFVLLLVGAGLEVASMAISSSAEAKPLAAREVPEPLRPWISWVLHDKEKLRCPFFHRKGNSSARGCAWPSNLRLQLDDRGGRFTQTWRIHVGSPVALVGDDKHWPEAVRVDGKRASVLNRNGRPHLFLEPGLRVVEGRFRWNGLPELLQIPAGTGLMTLALRGKAVEFPNRDVQGRLWLQKRSEVEAGESSRIAVVVHRRAIDDTPFLLETRIELRVSGDGREVLLSKALPDGFVPMSLQSVLPARLDPDGRLRVQVRPGTWVIHLMSRHEGPVQSLTVPTQPAIGDEGNADESSTWALDEVWAFEARPNLRMVDVSGVASIDPTQTTIRK